MIINKENEYIIEQIELGFQECNLPEYMKEGVLRYIFDGILSGSFLGAILENNLVGAFKFADDNNLASMKDWVRFLYWHLPSNCWGSEKKVKKWRGLNNIP